VPGFELRRATAEDLGLLVQHRHMMLEEMMKRPTKEELRVHDESYRLWAKEMMKRRLLHGYVVTTVRGKPAASGCVWLREVQPSPGHPHGMVPYVLSMYTQPEFRRKGLASMIIEEAMKWGRKHGHYKIILHASLTGRKVYSKLGWKRTWEMEFRYDDHPGRPGRLRRGRSLRPSRPSGAARRRQPAVR
jgi:GNAT superfamily N-acetyltransferase